MGGLALFVTAVALAMDAFAVAVAAGVQQRTSVAGAALRMALCFGIFQALMPTLGWLGGIAVRSSIEQYDHWVAFFLLAAIGAHMIYESCAELRKANDDTAPREENRADATRGRLLLMLGVATSIDALAVGISLSVLGTGILVPALVIGGMAFALTLAGVFLGRAACNNQYISRYAGMLGGATLIVIGVNILRDHQVF